MIKIKKCFTIYNPLNIMSKFKKKYCPKFYNTIKVQYFLAYTQNKISNFKKL